MCPRWLAAEFVKRNVSDCLIITPLHLKLSFFVVCAAFGEPVVSIFVAGAVIGESMCSLFMACAAFGIPLLSFFVAGATFGDLKCLILPLRKIWRTFRSSLNLWFLQSRKGKKRCLRSSKGGVARQQGDQSRSCQFSKERLL